LRLRSAIVLLVFGSAGCSGILGIQDATCDPGLAICNSSSEPEAGATTGGESTTGGVAAIDTDADTDVDDGGPSALCQEYCDTVLANCAGPFAVYVGPTTCLAVCRLLPEGMPGDDMVNTVQCRLKQAHNALDLQDPQTHCPAAGPSGTNANGENLCGTTCDGYCAIIQAACLGEDFSAFSSLDACLTACKEVPDLKGYDLTVTTGDSIQCRLWHVSAAADEPNPHCKHAAGNYPCQ
jgi:hypothetical protein